MRSMRLLLFFLLLLCAREGMGQCKSFTIASNGDTLNCQDIHGLRQGRWVNRYDNVRGEPGYEEQGIYQDGRKVGKWTQFSLMGDVIGVETYKWGNKDGTCLYYNNQGELVREESWKAFNPEKEIDTVMVEDVDRPGNYVQKIIQHKGASVRHGEWRIYEAGTGVLVRKDVYYLGVLDSEVKNNTAAPPAKKETPKPKEVQEFERKNKGKTIKVRDGRTGG